MPTVSVNRNLLFSAFGQNFSEESFDELCFEFGIELDDVTTPEKVIRKEKHLEEEPGTEADEETIYKIEVPANRYDLLCLEGIARALRIFKGKEDVPAFNYATVSRANIQQLTVKPETSLIRPFIVAAILRGVNFNQARFESFIDLQDKLHQNLCRKRTLVAIGTHDLDKVQGPFSYEVAHDVIAFWAKDRFFVCLICEASAFSQIMDNALPPSEIKFVPLKQDKEFNGEELMQFYKNDAKIKKFLPIIEGSSVYPVVFDSKRTVLSLPPIINGAHSAMTPKTRNVFIECTATDLTKANIVLNTVVTMFSQYCEHKFEVEQVEVIRNGQSELYPDLSVRKMEVDVSYINDTIGIRLAPREIAGHLYSMQLPTKIVREGDKPKVAVTVPPNRSDVLHPCDVMEDVAIAYGFNNITKTVPKSHTLGKQQLLNHFTDLLREEIALAGYTEILSWILGSNLENFFNLSRLDDKEKAVTIGNPRSSEFEVVRTSLLPGILKTMAHNKKTPRPVQLFEISDVVLLDSKADVGASNQRHLTALYCNQTSGFEFTYRDLGLEWQSFTRFYMGLSGREAVLLMGDKHHGSIVTGVGGVDIIHGLVDRVMTVVGATKCEEGEKTGYYIKPSAEPEFFTGRQAHIIFKGETIGSFGIIHPRVLQRFDIPDPCSAMELNIEAFL